MSISRDWGLTFQPLNPPGNGFSTAGGFDGAHPGWIYVDKTGGTQGSLSLTTDYGATWMPRGSPPAGFTAIAELAPTPDQPSILLAALIDGSIYESTDQAATWTRVSPSFGPVTPAAMFPFVPVSRQCSPGGGLFAVVNGSGYYQAAFSPDYGMTWNTPRLSAVSAIAGGTGCAVYAVRRPAAQQETDAFVAKLDPSGAVLWATYLGGSDQDSSVAIALDSAGRVYVAGSTVSTDFPATAPAIGVTGQSSVFVTRFSADGAMESSVVIGGSATNTASSLALDALGTFMSQAARTRLIFR